MKQLITLFFCIGIVFTFQNISAQQPAPPFTDQMIKEYWQAGKTLPVEVSRQYPWPDYNVKHRKNDSGINVMIDLAHQCSFASLWSLPPRLRDMGFRAVGNMSGLNAALKKGGVSRIRLHYDMENKIFPFGWWDNPEYNVVITEQSDSDAQLYTEEEIQALQQFVAQGGGLIIMASPQKNKDKVENWSINKLAAQFGASFLPETDKANNINYLALKGNFSKIIQKGESGKIISGGLKYKKGNVILIGNPNAFRFEDKDSQEKKDQVLTYINESVTWAAKGKKPVGGKPGFPINMGGGDGIYPELEHQEGSIVLFYAANQKPELLECVKKDVPVAMQQVEKWLPSKPTAEPMYLILCAGDGGGWAVNAFKPKENGIISSNQFGILSIFGHELAHTMGGPRNAQGEIAGLPPIPNQGEAHAGWFQGKVNAIFDSKLLCKSNRECNKIFEKEGVVKTLDLKKHYENEEGRAKWGYGTAWNKVWYIWQKFDDRYGSTWYPRWKWVQYTRWANEPERKLSWEEMIEDMSIAVGEDLFPFFIQLGTSLDKKRLESIQFQGKEIKLKVAPLQPTLAEQVRLEYPGDYTQPLSY